MSQPGPVRIVVIDDSDSDHELFRIALADLRIENPMEPALDGATGLEILRRNVGARQLVLLDLNLPGMNGEEILAEIRRDPALAATPVIVFTSSDLQDDIARTYSAGANAFVRKPLDIEAFNRMVEAIDRFWLRIVEYG